MTVTWYIEKLLYPHTSSPLIPFYPFSCTVLRALGIPARPVTNYVSAHDTDANQAVDFYFDEKGVEIEHLSSDYIWYARAGYCIICVPPGPPPVPPGPHLSTHLSTHLSHPPIPPPVPSPVSLVSPSYHCPPTYPLACSNLVMWHKLACITFSVRRLSMHPPYCAVQRKLTPSPIPHHPLASPHMTSNPAYPS